jgi:hypothetical protein
MNKQAILSIVRKMATIAGLPMILLVFIIVYGEAKSIVITLLILTPIIVLWTRFVTLWLQEQVQDADQPEAQSAAPEAIVETRQPRDA